MAVCKRLPWASPSGLSAAFSAAVQSISVPGIVISSPRLRGPRPLLAAGSELNPSSQYQRVYRCCSVATALCCGSDGACASLFMLWLPIGLLIFM